MARRTQRSMVGALERLGLRFETVTVASEGDYTVADADWNYKDVPHLNNVHGWAENVSGVVDSDAVASVTVQRVLGVRFPVVLSHYESGPDRQTYFFTLLGFTVVGEVTFEALPTGRTRVVTSYAVGAGRLRMLLFPLVRWALTRNYRQLMTEDLPMRERHGLLRRWGYGFRGDGAARTFTASVPIERDNVVPPERPPGAAAPSIPLADLGDGGTVLWGESDHLGLRLERVGHRVDVYPRMCRHEGACLDDVVAVDCVLRCPWHGRPVGAVASLDLGRGGVVETADHRLEVVGDEVVVAVRPAAPIDDRPYPSSKAPTGRPSRSTT